MSKIFLSYARANSEKAARLRKALEDRGVAIWMDTDGIAPMSPWRQEIEDALAKAAAVIVIWSKESLNSPHVLDEADFARSKKKLLQIFTDESTPPLGFRSIQGVAMSLDETSLQSVQFQTLLQTVTRALLEHGKEVLPHKNWRNNYVYLTKQGDLEGVLAYLEDVISRDPSQTDAKLEKIELLVKHGRAPEAWVTCESLPKAIIDSPRGRDLMSLTKVALLRMTR